MASESLDDRPRTESLAHEASILQSQGERTERHARAEFEYWMEAFFKRYAPADAHAAAEFHRDLTTLVRQIYRDAQAPLLAQWEKALSASLSLQPQIFPSITALRKE